MKYQVTVTLLKEHEISSDVDAVFDMVLDDAGNCDSMKILWHDIDTVPEEENDG